MSDVLSRRGNVLVCRAVVGAPAGARMTYRGGMSFRAPVDLPSVDPEPISEAATRDQQPVGPAQPVAEPAGVINEPVNLAKSSRAPSATTRRDVPDKT